MYYLMIFCGLSPSILFHKRGNNYYYSNSGETGRN
jgi:hypothetical protein